MYSPQVLDHFEHPRNAGELNDADVTVERSNQVCGDRLRLQLKLEGDVITEARFKVVGCTPTYACASVLTEMVTGKSADFAASVSWEKIVEALGGLPPASNHASKLAIETMRAAIAECSKLRP